MWLIGLLACPLGCESSLVLGELQLVEPVCSGAAGASEVNDNGMFNSGPLPAPWETSFSDGFCSYEADAGFCYGADHHIVSEPTHTPPFAAAFEIGGATRAGLVSKQTRCAREGQLPEEAFYGAWFYLPENATELDNWNLMHFQGRQPGVPVTNLWDVSIEERPAGLTAYVYGFHPSKVYRQPEPIAVPLGRWFQLELYLKRASDATGVVALYQDGREVLRLEQLVTDDTSFGQWYVGNLADQITPSHYTLYVDDVTIRLR